MPLFLILSWSVDFPMLKRVATLAKVFPCFTSLHTKTILFLFLTAAVVIASSARKLECDHEDSKKKKKKIVFKLTIVVGVASCSVWLTDVFR